MAIPSFLLKSGSSEFLNRQRNLFDVLDSAEKEKNLSANVSNERMEIEVDESKRRQRKITKQFRGKESLFNEPVELPKRFKKFNQVPDYQKNPHKWTKYSLGDITQDKMSNESNTAAAMSFLRDIELQKAKSNSEGDHVESDKPFKLPSQHCFNITKNSNLKRTNTEIVEDVQQYPKCFYKNNRFLMAEYVVGQNPKPVKVARKKISPKEKGKEVFLNHIHEYDDE